MNAQQLRNSILQEAIEGRLVPQDPNDEPASALLARIRKEKEQLVKEGKLKKKDLVETPISEDEKPFEIPESWEWVRLKDIVMFIGGYAYDSTSFIPSSNNQVLRLGNVKNDNILLNVNPVFIDDKLALDTEKFRCKENDILITMTGTRKKRDYFFSVLVNSSHQNLYINQRVGCLRSIEENIAKWLVIALKTEVILTDVFQYETGTANQGNLGAENILKTKIPLPPLAEQHRIVAKIEELLPKVEEYGKAQDALDKLNEELPERLKKSVLQEAITGRLVPQDPNDEPASVLLQRIRAEKERLVKEGKLKKKDLVETPISEDEIPFEIPESWEWVHFSLLFNVRSAKRIHQSDWKTSGIPFFRGRELVQLIKTGNVNPEIFINEDLYNNVKEFGLPQKDDILISAVGTIGKVYIVKGTKPFYYKDAYILCCENFSKITPNYFAIAINSPFVQQQIHQDAMATTVAQLTIERAKNLLIPLPPLAEQKRIVAKIEEVFKEIDKLKNNG